MRLVGQQALWLVNALKLKDILLIRHDFTGSFWPLALGRSTGQSYPTRGTCMAEEQQGTVEQVVAILRIISVLNFDAFALHELSCAIEAMAEEKKHVEENVS